MFVRACCLPVVCIVLTAGCQSPSSALFPWKDDSSVPSLTEAELKRSREALQVEQDAFRDTTQEAGAPTSTVSLTETSKDDDSSQRVALWLQRGQDAIRRSSENAQPDAMLAEATQSFRKVLQMDSDNADAWHGLAIVSDLNEDWDVADMSYKRALAMRPDDVNLLNDQGYSYVLQSRYHEASQYLNRALQISPGHEKAHINLAILDIRRGNSTSALERLSRVYPAGQAQAALASLTQEYAAPGADTLPLRHPASQNGPQTLTAGAGDSRNATAVSGRNPQTFPGHQQSAHPAGQSSGAPSGGIQRQTIQTQTVQTNADQPPLFSQVGVIQPRPGSSDVRTAAATDYQNQGNRVSPANMRRPVDSMANGAAVGGSPLASARRVGGTFQMPANWNNIRPQLPASANVYQYHQPSAPGHAPQQAAAQQPYGAPPSSAAPHSMPGSPLNGQSNNFANSQGQFPQGQYPQGQRPQGQFPHGQPHSQYPAGLPAVGLTGQQGFAPQPFAGSGAVSPGSMNGHPQIQPQPRLPTAAASKPISILPSTGGTPPGTPGVNTPPASGSYYENQAPAPGTWGQPGVSPSVNPGYQAPQANWQTHGSQAVLPAAPGLPPGAAPGMTPAAWPQTVPGGSGQPSVSAPYPAVNPGVPPAGVPGAQSAPSASLAPPYFSPPPLSGNGYSEPTAPAAADPLSEYRATRQQLDSDYNRTLQRLDQQSGTMLR